MRRKIAILALIALAGVIAVIYPVISQTAASHLQPPTPTPNAHQRAAIAEQTATAEAKRYATPTPQPLTGVPGAKGEGAINCYLARGETWTAIRYLAGDDGRVYVFARTEAGCYGWMIAPR